MTTIIMMMACVAIPTYSAYVPVPLFPSPFSSARASYFLDLDKAAGFCYQDQLVKVHARYCT
jgi:hypothetical protein